MHNLYPKQRRIEHADVVYMVEARKLLLALGADAEEMARLLPEYTQMVKNKSKVEKASDNFSKEFNKQSGATYD